MKNWALVGMVVDIILRVFLAAVVVVMIYRGAITCYDYGYRVFTEEPMSATVGRSVTLQIPVDCSAKEMGEMFEAAGLSRDAKLFMLQYYASEYREGIKGGTYTFETTMTAEEMFAVMAGESVVLSDAEAETEDTSKQPEELPEVLPQSEDGEFAEE